MDDQGSSVMTAEYRDRAIERALKHLAAFLDVFSLQTMPDSLAHCIQVSIRILLLSPDRFRVLGRACAHASLRKHHGSMEIGASIVLQSILPWLVDPPVAGGAATAVALRAHKLMEEVIVDVRDEEEKAGIRRCVRACVSAGIFFVCVFGVLLFVMVVQVDIFI